MKRDIVSPGERHRAGVTSRDVARLAGVSQATVSRALRGDTRISLRTRGSVRAAAETLGYVRSALGRSLSTRSTRQIAMVADLANQLYPRLVPSIHDRLHDANYRLTLLAERPEQGLVADQLLDRSIDGAILTTSYLDSTLPAQLHKHHVPFVYLNRVTDQVDAPSVTMDNIRGGELVAQLLLDLGHRRVGAIFSSPNTSTGRDRERGFRDTLARSKVTLSPAHVHHGWFTFEHGREGMAKILSSRYRPTAVFCASDLIAVGAMAQARRQNLRVPEDLTVVGFDNLDVASWPWLELTTVANPLSIMAETAVDLLLEQLGDQPSPIRHRMWPAEIVLRKSHAPGPHQRVAKLAGSGTGNHEK